MHVCRLALFGVFVLISPLLLASGAYGIYNGQSATGSPYVVKVLSAGSACSGALISSRIVATAAHCIIRSGAPVALTSLRVYGAGVDLARSSDFARVENFVYPANFRNLADTTEPNDIAFLALDRDWAGVAIDGLADFDLTREIVSSGAAIEVFGYGSVKSQSDSSPTPNSFIVKATEQIRYRDFIGFERKYVTFMVDESGAVCPGDSGGPAIARYEGRIYLISVSSGGSGPCNKKPESTGSVIATVAGEYLDLLEQAKKFLPVMKPLAPIETTITSNGASAQITWVAPFDSSKSISAYVVTNAQGDEICRTVRLVCKVDLDVGLNSFRLFSISGAQRSEEREVRVDLQLPIPHSMKVTNIGARGVLSWTIATGFDRLLSGFIVSDSQNQVLCHALTTQCPVTLRAGENSFVIRSLSSGVQSDAAVLTIVLKNASTPATTDVKIEKNSALVTWSKVIDVADASVDSIKVRIINKIDNSILCEAALDSEGCRFALLKKNFHLGVQISTDLGDGPIFDVEHLSGVDALKRISHITSVVKIIHATLNQLLMFNPGYKTEVSALATKVPLLNDTFNYDVTSLEKVQKLYKDTSALQSKIEKNPRTIDILCKRGTVTKKISGQNPSCPRGYTRIRN